MPNAVLTRAIDALASRQDLSTDAAASVLSEIMSGNVSDAQAAAFLVALRTKGETVDELVGLARAMRALAVPVEFDGDDLVDTAGTGGGRLTFNVSTAAALVAAAAGCRVAKHGNRSATGRSGSADVLEALGARIDLPPEAVADCIERIGFGFMFAPHHHRAMGHVVSVRRELGVRTIFNFLGPLTNPAGATRQLIGVSDAAYLDTIASALSELGATRAMVVSSEDGLDEVSASGVTRVVELRDGAIEEYALEPEKLGVERVSAEAVRGGDPDQSAEIVRAVLSGERGADRTITVLNAAAAIFVGGRADSLRAGLEAAEQAIDSGAARTTLDDFVEHTRAVAG